jgi:hypothetical protein
MFQFIKRLFSSSQRPTPPENFFIKTIALESPNSDEEVMVVHIVDDEGKLYLVECQPSESVKNVMARYETPQGLTGGCLFTPSRQPMWGECSLKNYNIQDDDNLRYSTTLYPPPPSMIT